MYPEKYYSNTILHPRTIWMYGYLDISSPDAIDSTSLHLASQTNLSFHMPKVKILLGLFD